jgi:hypothetical protein
MIQRAASSHYKNQSVKKKSLEKLFSNVLIQGLSSGIYIIDFFSFSFSTDNKKFNCARNVSTILCVHEAECSPFDCSGHGTCKEGVCQCDNNWRGLSCNHLSCQDKMLATL